MKKGKLLRNLMTLLFMVAIVFILWSVDASAATILSGNCGKNGGNVKFTLTDAGVLTISGTGEMADYDYYQGRASTAPWCGLENGVVIKSLIIEDGVTYIGEFAFYGRASLESVTIGNSVTEIGEAAFDNCKALTGISLPISLRKINDSVFIYCSSLKSVVIPQFVDSIGNKVFSYCDSLTSVTLPDKFEKSYNNNGNNTIWGFSKSVNVTFTSSGCGKEGKNVTYKLSNDGVLTISGTGEMADYTHNYNSNITSAPWSEGVGLIKKVIIAGGVENVGNDAFCGCTSLTSVEISNSVTRIGDYAFGECSSLAPIKIPNSVKRIGLAAFSNCKALSSIIIPPSVSNISFDFLNGCSRLFEIYLPEVFENDINIIKNKSRLSSTVDIIYITKKCGNSVTYKLSDDGTLTIEGNGDMKDYSCSNDNITTAPWIYCYGEIKNVKIESKVTNIGDFAFCGCSSLASIEIPTEVTHIGKRAFLNCTSLTSITIPQNVTQIGDGAFGGCTSLTSLTIPNTFEDYIDTLRNRWGINSNVSITFSANGCGKEDRNVIYKLNLDGVLTISGSGEMMNYELEWDNELNKNIVKTPWFDRKSEIKSVVIGDDITSIGTYAFYGCDSLTSIALPRRFEKDFSTLKSKWALNDNALPTFADNGCGKEGDNVFYELSDDGVLTISGIGDMADYEENTDGIITTPWANKSNNIKSVIIGAGVTHIGDYAFKDCKFLLSVEIADSVTSIGAYAFANCKTIYRILIPKYVKSISDTTFRGCDIYIITLPACFEDDLDTLKDKFGLTRRPVINYIHYPIGSEGFNVTYDIEGSTVIIEGSGKMVDFDWDTKSPFRNSSIEQVIIKDGVENVGGHLFLQNGKLTSVTIPNSVTSIGDYAFGECGALKSLSIPDGVVSIGNYAFVECGALESLNIPNSVTRIGDHAFDSCISLKTIEIPNSVTYIGRQAFKDCIGLSIIEIPPSVTSLGLYAFDNSSNLTLVALPEFYRNDYRVKRGYMGIDSNATVVYGTYGCGKEGRNVTYKLSDEGKLTINGTGEMVDYDIDTNGITTTPWSDSANKINTIEISDGVTSIGKYAFSGCTKITSIEIPPSVTVIGDGAFSECVSLTSIILPEIFEKDYATLKDKWGLNADVDPTFTTIFCGKEGKNVTYKLNADGVLTISGSGEMADYGIIWDNELLSFISNTPWDYKRNEIKSVIISDGVTSIGDYAFYGCTSLSTVEIGNKVESIGESVFSGCTSLSTVEIGNKVESIGESAFSGCTSLSTVKIGNKVESIGESAFSGCTSLSTIGIGNKVESIGESAFSGCTSLSTIEIPNSVTSIGGGAFNECTLLTEIEIPNSVTYIGSNAFDLCVSLQSLTLSETFKKDINTLRGDWGLNLEATVAYTHVKEKIVSEEYINTPATCTTPAVYYLGCKYCDEKFGETYEYGKALGHNPVIKDTPATDKKDGSHIKECSRCSCVYSNKKIPRAYITVEDTVKLNKKGSKATVSVTDVNGKKIASSNYTLKYSNNKKVGKASVTITFMGKDYKGKVTKNFTVADSKEIPGKIKLKSAKSNKKKLTITWNKAKSPAKGYELQYSTDKNFLQDVKTVKVSNASTVSTSVSKLSKGKYYIRIRVTNKTKKYTAYGAWSKVMNVSVK